MQAHRLNVWLPNSPLLYSHGEEHEIHRVAMTANFMDS